MASDREPSILEVSPSRHGNRVRFLIRILDEQGRGVPKAVVTILDGPRPNVTRKYTDRFGELLHVIQLVPGDRRLVEIHVSGFGMDPYRETWEWREPRGEAQEDATFPEEAEWPEPPAEGGGEPAGSPMERLGRDLDRIEADTKSAVERHPKHKDEIEKLREELIRKARGDRE